MPTQSSWDAVMIMYTTRDGLSGICQDYDDYDEEIEVDDWVPGKTGGAHMAAPSSTRCLY